MSVSDSPSLPLTALQRIETAALQLVAAVRSAGTSPVPQDKAVPSLVTVINEFLISKARSGRSVRYLGLLVKQLRAFSKGREDVPAVAISAGEIEKWLYDQEWSAKTRHGALLTLRNLFEYAIGRAYMVNNPALAVDLPTIDLLAPGVHSPEQVATVLTSCSDPSTQRYLAIRYFAGLRGSEAEALDENEIHDRFVEVTAAKAKTRRRRLVSIQPNLSAWLKFTKDRGGRLPLHQVNNKLCAAVKNSGVQWPRNVTRHSFVSYHLAEFGSAAKTALESGHSEQMLFSSYRELKTLDGDLITPEVSAEFWNIRPPRKKRRSKMTVGAFLRRAQGDRKGQIRKASSRR